MAPTDNIKESEDSEKCTSESLATEETSVPIVQPFPEWINKCFFQDILKKEFDTFEILTLDVTPATGKGENFASVMYRVHLKVEVNDKDVVYRSYILKALPDLGVHGEIMKEFNVFPKEIEMYDVLLPCFERMYKDVGVEIQFGPRCLQSGYDPTDYIVMEDLKERNFVLGNRQRGLDLDRCKLVLDKLAKFHAASAVYYEQHGPFQKRFDEGVIAERLRPMYEKFYDINCELYDKIMRSWPFGDQYADMMRQWISLTFKRVKNLLEPNPNGFNVLCHGDLWCNNTMFSYDDEGKPKDACLLDYQMCMFSSPATDLNYFIFTSCQPDIKVAKMDSMVHFYHSNLKEALQLLKYPKPIPTLLELQIDVMKKGLYGLWSTLGLLPICMADSSEESEMAIFSRTDEKATEFKYRTYNNPRYVETMTNLFPYFSDRGYMELP